MDVADKLRALERKRILLTVAGGMGTLLYLCLLGWWAKWSDLPGMPLNNIGDFLAGAFAPLAFLWLVIGYFLQAIELKQNSESLMQQAAEMQNAVEQATEQARAMKMSEVYSRQDVINQTRRQYERDLGGITSKLYIIFGTHLKSSFLGVEEKFISGYSESFADRIVNISGHKHSVLHARKKIETDGESLSYLHRYMRLYEDFMQALSTLSASDAIFEYYKRGPFESIYKYAQEAVANPVTAEPQTDNEII